MLYKVLIFQKAQVDNYQPVYHVSMFVYNVSVSTNYKKRIKGVNCPRPISQKIFYFEKLDFESYQLAFFGGGIWVRHALLI